MRAGSRPDYNLDYLQKKQAMPVGQYIFHIFRVQEEVSSVQHYQKSIWSSTYIPEPGLHQSILKVYNSTWQVFRCTHKPGRLQNHLFKWVNRPVTITNAETLLLS